MKAENRIAKGRTIVLYYIAAIIVVDARGIDAQRRNLRDVNPEIPRITFDVSREEYARPHALELAHGHSEREVGSPAD